MTKNAIVVNSSSIEVAADDSVKTDSRDATKIAAQLAAGKLKGIYILCLWVCGQVSLKRPAAYALWASAKKTPADLKSLSWTIERYPLLPVEHYIHWLSHDPYRIAAPSFCYLHPHQTHP